MGDSPEKKTIRFSTTNALLFNDIDCSFETSNLTMVNMHASLVFVQYIVLDNLFA